MQTLTVRLMLTEPMLGTVPYDPEVYARFIETKKPKEIAEDEAATVEARELGGWTGFHHDKEGLFLFDYQVKGMLKELASIRYAKTTDDAVPAIRSKIDNFVYIRPRRIRIPGPTEILERPLRAQTRQGPRVTVVRSDTIPAGTLISCTVVILPGPISRTHIVQLLALGEFRGLGQWRNGGYGRFYAEVSA